MQINELETDKKIHTNSYKAYYDKKSDELIPILNGKIYDKVNKPNTEKVKPLKDFFNISFE